MTVPTDVRNNYQAALMVEAKLVIRCFQQYTHEQRADHLANHRLGHKQRKAVGEYYYCHPDYPNIAFPTRRAAAKYALVRS